MRSVWNEGSLARVPAAPLAGDVSADVVIVGGGITGLMTALATHEAGLRTIVLEADAVGRSNTGGSTGNLYATLSQGLAPIRRKWGADVARRVAQLRTDAVLRLESLAQRLDLAGQFGRVPLLLAIGSDEAKLDELEDELRALEEAGLAPVRTDAFPSPVRAAIAIANQAQFNPLRFVQALAGYLEGAGVTIHEGTRAIDADAGDGCVRTEHGVVRARHLVFATHTPKGFNLVQAEMEPYLEYGIATQAATLPEPGIHWIRDEGRSIRTHGAGGARWLVVVGEKHKTGQHAPGVDYLARLERTAQVRFGAGTTTHRWNAQQYRSADGLPYIGRSAHDNVYIATGFGADGLTWGTVASRLIATLVQGREDEDTKLLTPRRFTPLKSAKAWASENVDVVEHMTVAYLRRDRLANLDDLPRNAGRIVTIDGHARAVYRGEDGALTVLSCVCPHLKCKVEWNGATGSWDCPCHGSRFAPHGQVLEGPAWSGLERITLGD